MKKAAEAVPNQRLINERLRLHWSQQQLADHVGTTRLNVSRWERGITSPGPYFRQQICDAFHKDAQELGLLLDECEREHDQRLDAVECQQEARLVTQPALSAQPPLLSTASTIEVQQTPFSPAPTPFSQLLPNRLRRRSVLTGLIGGALLAGAGGAALLFFRPVQKAPVLGTTLCDYRGHSLQVRCVAWSPDGKYLLSAGGDTTVQIWTPDSEMGHVVRVYRKHWQRVDAAVWSPDGSRVASSSGNSIHVWDATTLERFLLYQGHTDVVKTLAWSPDGQYIASGGIDNIVQVWNATTGQPLSTYRGHSGWINRVAWSPQSRRIASGSRDKTVQVWDALTGKQVYIYRGHQQTIHAVAWSSDGTLIASGSEDSTVRVWDAAKGADRSISMQHSTRVAAIAWSPDGQRLAFGGYDTVKVEIEDATKGMRLFSYAGHTGSILAVTWSPDGTRIASAGNDRTVRVWLA